MAIFPPGTGSSPPSIPEMIGMGAVSLGVMGYVLKVAVESIKIPMDLSHIEPGSPLNPTLFLLIGVITILMVVISLLVPQEATDLEDLLPAHVTIPEPWGRMP